jgi:hypothetical protein
MRKKERKKERKKKERKRKREETVLQGQTTQEWLQVEKDQNPSHFLQNLL